MKLLNQLVEDYQAVLKATQPGSREREQAGIIYLSIKELVAICSRSDFNLNKIKPHTLQFLDQRGMRIRTQRAGGTKLRKKKTKKRKRLGRDLSI